MTLKQQNEKEEDEQENTKYKFLNNQLAVVYTKLIWQLSSFYFVCC